MPTVSTTPAMPGSVSVALSIDKHAEDHGDVDRHGDIGEQAEQAVGDEHEDDHHGGADVGTDLALGDRVGAEAGADRALLDDGERRRQRAGAQQDGEVVGALHGEIAGNLPGTAEDRLADHRRRDHLVVEHDGEGLADILLRHLGELARARGVEAEIDHRLAGALDRSPAARRSSRRPTPGSASPPHRFGSPRGRCRAGSRLPAATGPAAPAPASPRCRPCGNRAWRSCRAAALSRVGSCRPGTCTRMRSAALARDQRLDRAELVDAPLDDLDRLVDRLAHPLHDRRFGHGEPDQIAVIADIDDCARRSCRECRRAAATACAVW